jgi:hypothetical protein
LTHQKLNHFGTLLVEGLAILGSRCHVSTARPACFI